MPIDTTMTVTDGGAIARTMIRALDGDPDAPGKRKASDHPDPVVCAVDVLFHPTVYLWARSDAEAVEDAYQHLLMADLDSPPVIRVNPTADIPRSEECGTEPYRIRHQFDTWWTYAHDHVEAAERFLRAAVGVGLPGSLVVTVERAS